MVTETQQGTLSDTNAAFLRAAKAGNYDRVLEFLDKKTDIHTANPIGLNALHLASKEGHVEIVKELLKRGANVNTATKKGNTALHIASLGGQLEVVKLLIQYGAAVNMQSQNGFTPLYMAAQENHDQVVRFLLGSGANQSIGTEDGFTPLAVALQQEHDKVVAVLLENDTKGKVRLPALHIAAKKDDTKAAALLLSNDHNPDVTSKSGFTPLHIAAHYGNENIGKLLIQKNADVNYAAKHQITPLHVASKWGKLNTVTLLVEHGADIEAKTRDGLTPLHCAARSGHDSVVDYLLERGAPISSKSKNGLTPLHMASQGDHVDSARILLYHKAPVDEVTIDYLTALHVAAHCGHVRVATLLLERKADPNARALNGFTPLHIACKKNRMKVVELLLKHGASIEATTESGLTPLHVAAFMGCMNIVIYLIQRGSNPDVPTVRGETPLHLAARANQTDIIRILLRNGAQVDARAREQQTPLHIAARLGNVDIVVLLLQHGASVDAITKDMYTALHIAAKEGQEEVAAVLLDESASVTTTTKKGFTPLHLSAKYGNLKVARLLLSRSAPVDAQGKNGVTPLHVASHYDHQNVALLLLDSGASPHAAAKNGYTPLHIAAKKNQMDIANMLMEYNAKTNCESKAGFTPLHLSAQEGHVDMCHLLIEHGASVNYKAKNGLTAMHLCAQYDAVNAATILAQAGASINDKTKAGYTPLHVACHFGQVGMVRFLLNHGAEVNMATSLGYTPLHQAAQQGHTLVITLLLENKASPNAITNQGQTALSIAQKLGYVSVVETLKVVTETIVTTTTTTITEEKYRVVAPETMQETFISDEEDEGGDDAVVGDQSFRYLTVDEMKLLGDDSIKIDVTRDERSERMDMSFDRDGTFDETNLSPVKAKDQYAQFTGDYAPDNVEISRQPVVSGFLVSFMVDARGGAMRGCRHSGVRVIVPPRKAPMPMRVTCRYLKKDKLIHPPPLMEGEALCSRILEMGPASAKFLGPVIIEVPHFASMRGREREISILRSDNGDTWKEHSLDTSEEAVQEVLNESFDGEDLAALEDLNTHRITRILTTDFPQYFAIVSRVRQEIHAIGPEGGIVSSSVVPQVQAVFPQGALTKRIKVGLQAQPVTPELVAKLLGNGVAVSPIVTVEPRRRKFHTGINLTIPVPQAAQKGMINQYSGEAPTLRLLCSITGGTNKAQWEDVTGSTRLTFVNDCVSFTTNISARFWLIDCRNIAEAGKMAMDLYKEAIHVPFMAKFVVFAKRHDPEEGRLRVFCMTDDKEEKTLEHQEHFVEVAKSRDVEVLEGKPQYIEFGGNLVPVTKSGEQLKLMFEAFRENRLPFTVRVKDSGAEAVGRIAFMREPKVGRGDPPQVPICNLNILLPTTISPEKTPSESDLLDISKKYSMLRTAGYHSHIRKPEVSAVPTIPEDSIHKAEFQLNEMCNLLQHDWVPLAHELGISESDIHVIQEAYPNNTPQQALVSIHLWRQRAGTGATGNTLEQGLVNIHREDIVKKCVANVELVTDDLERAVARVRLDQSGFDAFKDELGPSRDASLKRNISLDVSYDEQDLVKESESAAEEDDTADAKTEENTEENASTPATNAMFVEDVSQCVEVKSRRRESSPHVKFSEEILTIPLTAEECDDALLPEHLASECGDADTFEEDFSGIARVSPKPDLSDAELDILDEDRKQEILDANIPAPHLVLSAPAEDEEELAAAVEDLAIDPSSETVVPEEEFQRIHRAVEELEQSYANEAQFKKVQRGAEIESHPVEFQEAAEEVFHQNLVEDKLHQEVAEKEFQQEVVEDEFHQEVAEEEFHQEVAEEEFHQEVAEEEFHQELAEEEFHQEAAEEEFHQEAAEEEFHQEIVEEEFHQKIADEFHQVAEEECQQEATEGEFHQGLAEREFHPEKCNELADEEFHCEPEEKEHFQPDSHPEVESFMHQQGFELPQQEKEASSSVKEDFEQVLAVGLEDASPVEQQKSVDDAVVSPDHSPVSVEEEEFQKVLRHHEVEPDSSVPEAVKQELLEEMSNLLMKGEEAEKNSGKRQPVAQLGDFDEGAAVDEPEIKKVERDGQPIKTEEIIVSSAAVGLAQSADPSRDALILEEDLESIKEEDDVVDCPQGSAGMAHDIGNDSDDHPIEWNDSRKETDGTSSDSEASDHFEQFERDISKRGLTESPLGSHTEQRGQGEPHVGPVCEQLLECPSESSSSVSSSDEDEEDEEISQGFPDAAGEDASGLVLMNPAAMEDPSSPEGILNQQAEMAVHTNPEHEEGSGLRGAGAGPESENKDQNGSRS